MTTQETKKRRNRVVPTLLVCVVVLWFSADKIEWYMWIEIIVVSFLCFSSDFYNNLMNDYDKNSTFGKNSTYKPEFEFNGNSNDNCCHKKEFNMSSVSIGNSSKYSARISAGYLGLLLIIVSHLIPFRLGLYTFRGELVKGFYLWQCESLPWLFVVQLVLISLGYYLINTNNYKLLLLVSLANIPIIYKFYWNVISVSNEYHPLVVQTFYSPLIMIAGGLFVFMSSIGPNKLLSFADRLTK